MKRVGRPKEFRRRLHRVRKGKYFYRGFGISGSRGEWWICSSTGQRLVEHSTLKSIMLAIDAWHRWHPGMVD